MPIYFTGRCIHARSTQPENIFAICTKLQILEQNREFQNPYKQALPTERNSMCNKVNTLQIHNVFLIFPSHFMHAILFTISF